MLEKRIFCRVNSCVLASKNKTVFIKNDIHLRKLVLMATERKRFVLVSQNMKSETYNWYHDCLGIGKTAF